MSNLLNNRVNITATATQLSAVKAAFQTVLTNMPFLVGLTAEERKSLSAIDVSNKAFVEDTINAGVNNALLVPSYISMASVQNDLTLFSQLDEISGLANQLCERIEDTKRLAGSEAYQSALSVYKAMASAADAGVPGADALVTQLKKRFPGSHVTPAAPIAAPPAQ